MKKRIDIAPGTDYKTLMAEYGVGRTTAFKAIKEGCIYPKSKTKEPHSDNETFQKFFDIIHLDYINAHGFADIDTIRLNNILMYRSFYITVSEGASFRAQIQELKDKLNALLHSSEDDFISNFKAVCACRFIHKRVLWGYKFSYQIKNKRKVLFTEAEQQEIKEIASKALMQL